MGRNKRQLLSLLFVNVCTLNSIDEGSNILIEKISIKLNFTNKWETTRIFRLILRKKKFEKLSKKAP